MSAASSVLVYGASGAQGGPVARRLLEQGTAVTAVSRRPDAVADLTAAGASVHVGDFGAPAGVAGHDAVFVPLPSAVTAPQFVERAREILTALRDSSAHVVVSLPSVVPPAPTGLAVPDSRVTALALVRELAPRAVVVNPTMLLENFSQALRGAINGGAMPYPVPADVPVAWLAVDDYAAYAVAALDRPDLAGVHLPTAGPDRLTGPELAEVIGGAAGHRVAYVPINEADFAGALTPFLGPEVGAAIAQMSAYAGTGGAALLDPDVTATLDALPVPRTPAVDWARRNFAG